jgi:hypothetical protein
MSQQTEMPSVVARWWLPYVNTSRFELWLATSA